MSEAGNPFIPVDTFLNRDLARHAQYRSEDHRGPDFSPDSTPDYPKAYQVRKVVPCKAAIDSYNNLPRPKKPPGRP